MARATAAVFVDGRRAGQAVLVDPRHLLTAAYVLQRPGPWHSRYGARGAGKLEFSGRGRTGRATS